MLTECNKEERGFRRFRLRGLGNVAAEWKLIGADRTPNLHLRKGGCCRVDLAGPAAHPTASLVGWLAPKQLKKLA